MVDEKGLIHPTDHQLHRIDTLLGYAAAGGDVVA
jgi:hypothetical protein